MWRRSTGSTTVTTGFKVTEGHRKRTTNTKIADPFSHVTPPTCSANGTISDDPHHTGSGNGQIMTPGRYMSSVSFPGNVRRVNMLPGIYCFEARITIGSQVLVRSVDGYATDGQAGSGGSVLLYVSGNNGDIRFNGTGAMQIRSIGYLNPAFAGCSNACEENFAIWIGQPACTDFDASGGSETSIMGVTYAPSSTVELGGNPNSNVLEGMVVADTIHLHGNVSMNLFANQDPIEMPPTVYLTQ